MENQSSDSLSDALTSFNNHGISLSIAEGSDDDSLEVCQWSEKSDDEESLPAASCSYNDLSIIDDPDSKSIDDDFEGSPRTVAIRNNDFLTSTPKKRTGDDEEAAPTTSSMPIQRFYSRVTGVRDSSDTTEESATPVGQWHFFRVMQTEGCAQECVTRVHGLSELDVLYAHSQFEARTPQEQNQWILDYFMSHCPVDEAGARDPKNITYIIAGRTVCLNIWLRVLAISVSRYYRLRQEFVTNGSSLSQVSKRSRAPSSKTMKAVAWMEQYFNRIGDKRPDKDGVYLPTCLTERKIYDVMIDELCQGDESKSICDSHM